VAQASELPLARVVISATVDIAEERTGRAGRLAVAASSRPNTRIRGESLGEAFSLKAMANESGLQVGRLAGADQVVVAQAL
jgi:hypothetical protein